MAPRRLVVACALLVLALLAPFPFFAWYGYADAGASGMLAASVAGLLCLVAGGAALVSTGLMAGKGPQSAVSGTLLGVLLQMIIPMAALVVFQRIGGPLTEAGVVGMLLVYYLVMLSAETSLAVWLLRPLRMAGSCAKHSEEKVA